eukprot:11759329-Ditylum_brightwellii.AAC.1
MEHWMDLWAKGDYTSLVKDTVVQWITGRDRGGLLQPTYIDPKTRDTVSEVLLSKHLDPTLLPVTALGEYENLPSFINLGITATAVEKVSSHMQRGKCISAVYGDYTAEACGIQQLCSVLKASIEGEIHTMPHLWKEHNEEESWGILLVDTKNAFNEINQQVMLWDVQHLSKEGVTQGDPLSMILYALAVLPIIK